MGGGYIKYDTVNVNGRNRVRFVKANSKSKNPIIYIKSDKEYITYKSFLRKRTMQGGALAGVYIVNDCTDIEDFLKETLGKNDLTNINMDVILTFSNDSTKTNVFVYHIRGDTSVEGNPFITFKKSIQIEKDKSGKDLTLFENYKKGFPGLKDVILYIPEEQV
jgi:hypothetical protein